MLLLLFTTALAAPLALDPAFIQQHNAAGGASWTAGVNERFAGLTVDEASALIGQVKTLTDPAEVEDARRGFDVIRGNSQANRDAADAVAVGRVPENFDARTQWPGCVHGVRNQGNCGGCWAYGASEVLSDRFCIASNGKQNLTLSPQDLISCAHVRTPPKYLLGCDGGVPEYAWQYLVSTGISTDKCIPAPTPRNTTVTCPTTGCAATKYKAKMGSNRLLNGAPSAAQQYVATGGPIQATLFVFKSFFAYKSGIYRHTGNDTMLGKHSLKIVGYGIDNGTDYWTVANSWGSKWGDHGYFKILRGSDECGIEGEMTLGDPLLTQQ